MIYTTVYLSETANTIEVEYIFSAGDVKDINWKFKRVSPEDVQAAISNPEYLDCIANTLNYATAKFGAAVAVKVNAGKICEGDLPEMALNKKLLSEYCEIMPNPNPSIHGIRVSDWELLADSYRTKSQCIYNTPEKAEAGAKIIASGLLAAQGDFPSLYVIQKKLLKLYTQEDTYLGVDICNIAGNVIDVIEQWLLAPAMPEL